MPLPVGYLPSARVSKDSLLCFLIIMLHQAIVKIGNLEIWRSDISKDSQQAELKQGFDKSGPWNNWKTQVLTIQIDDAKKSVSSFGSHSWKTSELVNSDIKRKIFALDAKVPSQTVTVSLKLQFI